MPQFDKITFFNQIFWLFIFFSIVYVLMLKFVLPKLSSSLKVRTKKLSKGNFGSEIYNKEELNIIKNYDKFVESFGSAVGNGLSSNSLSSQHLKELNSFETSSSAIKNSSSKFSAVLKQKSLINVLLNL